MAVLENASEINMKDVMDSWHNVGITSAHDLLALRKQLDANHVDNIRNLAQAHADFVRRLNETGPSEVALETLSSAQALRGMTSSDLQAIAAAVAAAVVAEMAKPQQG